MRYGIGTLRDNQRTRLSLIWINFVSKKSVGNKALVVWPSGDFRDPMGQMDLSCPQTVKNEILQKYREIIPLVQICFRFELSLTVLKL